MGLRCSLRAENLPKDARAAPTHFSKFKLESLEKNRRAPNGKSRKEMSRLPIDLALVRRLIILEDLSTQGEFNQSISTQIVEIYAQLVEYFDHKKDPIKVYFLDKMQNTITSQTKIGQSMNAELQLKKDSLSYANSAVKNTLRQLDEDADRAFERRAMQRSFAFKLKSAAQKLPGNENEIPRKLEDFEERTRDLDAIVRTQLRSQEKSISSRLEERRKHSANKSRSKNDSMAKSRDSSLNEPPYFAPAASRIPKQALATLESSRLHAAGKS